MSKRIRRGQVVFGAILSGFLALSVSVFFIVILIWLNGFAESFSRLTLSGNRIPVTLTVYGRTTDSATGEDTISARVDFYNGEGDFAGTVERSWSGWELKLDCVMVAAGKGWLAFPFLAYTDETKDGHGVDLLRLYDRNHFPAIYESTLLNKAERADLRRLFTLVKTERWMPEIFGSLHHETVSIRSFEAGAVYSLFVTRDGKLKLLTN